MDARAQSNNQQIGNAVAAITAAMTRLTPPTAVPSQTGSTANAPLVSDPAALGAATEARTAHSEWLRSGVFINIIPFDGDLRRV